MGRSPVEKLVTVFDTNFGEPLYRNSIHELNLGKLVIHASLSGTRNVTATGNSRGSGSA